MTFSQQSDLIITEVGPNNPNYFKKTRKFYDKATSNAELINHRELRLISGDGGGSVGVGFLVSPPGGTHYQLLAVVVEVVAAVLAHWKRSCSGSSPSGCTSRSRVQKHGSY